MWGLQEIVAMNNAAAARAAERREQAVAELAAQPDFTFENHGSVWLCRPNNEEARRLLDRRTDDTGAQWFGNALAVEHRYVADLAIRLEEDGYTVTLP